MKDIIKYLTDRPIDFGKYKGHNIKEIYKFAPDYLDWCLINVEKFYIDLAEIKTLPTPTPMKVGLFTINSQEYWVANVFPDKNYITDAFKFLELGNTLEESEFNFSDDAIAAAKEKAEILDGLCEGRESYEFDDFDVDEFED